jgi:hypothetical protein
MKLRIGFLTTIAVNVGDEFIREGIRAVLDRTGVSYLPLYVNKHDPGSLARPYQDEPIAVVDKYWDADVFIQAGAPVYWNISDGASTSITSEWHEWMWKDRILAREPAGRPQFLNLGAGSCQPWADDGSAYLDDPQCVAFARDAAARASLTTVRDPLSARILSTLCIPHQAMPCPAFLAAARHCYSKASESGVIGVNLMPVAGHYQIDPAFDRSVWMLHCWMLVSSLRKLGRLIFVAHDDIESRFMSQFASAGERVFSAPAWRDYLDVYGACVAVVANRVHGAVCAAGFGVPSVVIGNDSRAMIADYIGIPKFRASVAEPGEVVAAVASLLARRGQESARLHDLRQTTLDEYVGLVAPVLPPPLSRHYPPPLIFEPRMAVEPEEGSVPAAIVDFTSALTAFSKRHDMPLPSDRSEIWACAWLWLNALGRLDCAGLKLVDLHGQATPVPWFMAALGAQVILLAQDSRWIPDWERWRSRLNTNLTWRIGPLESWPIGRSWADAVSAFSMPRLDLHALAEAGRFLRPGGLLTISLRARPPQMDVDWHCPADRIDGVGQIERALFNIPGFRQMRETTSNAVDVHEQGGTAAGHADPQDWLSTAAILQRDLPGGQPGLAACELDLHQCRARTTERIEHLLSIRNALEAYYARHHAYPRSSGGWDGLYSLWGKSTPDWIPGLTPGYFVRLPRDPRNSSRPDQQYLYKSDGHDYKIICHGAEDTADVRKLRPDLIDPVRSSWAYGFFTKSAAQW